MSLANIDGRLTPAEMENIMAGSCSGRVVNDCFMDVYTNHGFASLWAAVQSAYMPATALVFAYACYAKNCS